MSAGRRRHHVAFDAPVKVKNEFGEHARSEWDQDRHRAWAELIYQSGSEAVEAARLAGRQVLKVKIRTGTAARSIQTGWQMRDIRLGTAWDIKEVDALTQRAFVFLVVEGPTV